MAGQDRRLCRWDRPQATRTSGGGGLDPESAARNGPPHPPQGRNGNYLFELEAQPGGPEGRSNTTAGSQPIGVIERPQSVPALRSCHLFAV